MAAAVLSLRNIRNLAAHSTTRPLLKSAEDPAPSTRCCKFYATEKRMQPSLATNAFRLQTYAPELVGSQRTRAAYSQVTTERTASRLVQQ